MAKKIINWHSKEFTGFITWLNETYGITLIKNNFQIQTNEHQSIMPIINSKINAYAHIYYTNSSVHKTVNNVPNFDNFTNWWHAGQLLWPHIKNAHFTTTDAQSTNESKLP